MTILVTGAKGQLGTELRHLLDEKKCDYIGVGVEELDITDKEAVDQYFTEKQPTVVFHCAAYTAVDKAEDEGKVANQQVNVVGTRNIAEASEKVGATLIYISTDYVFNGEKKEGKYQVDDVTDPQNEYGRAKLEGEQEVEKNMSHYYIIRTSWVFGAYGPNFVFTMQKLAQSHPKLTVVNDQFGRPTWTRDLAEFMVYAVDQKIPYGTYHFSNDNSCTWYDFACEILKDEKIEIEPVDSSAFPQKAKRPKYSIMDLSKVKETGFIIPTWQEALSSMIKQIKDR